MKFSSTVSIFFFFFEGIAYSNYIIFHASQVLWSYKIFEISFLCYINFPLLLYVHDIYMIFVHKVLSYTRWALFSEQIEFQSNWSLRKCRGWTQSYSLNHQKARVVLFNSGCRFLIHATSKSNRILTGFHLSSLLEPVKQCGFAYSFWTRQVVNSWADCTLPEPSAVWFGW